MRRLSRFGWKWTDPRNRSSRAIQSVTKPVRAREHAVPRPKMSVPDHRRTRVPAAIHMMFDGPTTTSGHDPPDVASHAAPVLPLRSGSPVRPLPPGRGHAFARRVRGGRR